MPRLVDIERVTTCNGLGYRTANPMRCSSAYAISSLDERSAWHAITTCSDREFMAILRGHLYEVVRPTIER